MIAGDEQHKSDASVDDVATEIVRHVAEASPPKSIETMKAVGDFAESGIVKERVRQRAYEMWEADGRPPGDGTNYWAKAEHELCNHNS